jgi:uncharacterized protein YbcC (UPF0753/DUF2309 family)
MTASTFDVQHILHELRHYLPSQTPLKDFIHHNTLHAFQNLNFYEAIFKASKIFGCNVTFSINDFRKLYRSKRISEAILERAIVERKGKTNLAYWKDKMLNQKYNADFTPRIGQLRDAWKSIYRIDLDNAVQPILFRILCSYLDQGVALWHFPFEDKGLLSAIRTLEQHSYTSFFSSARAKALLLDEKNCTIEHLLQTLVGDASYFEQYLFDQQFTHRGWSGMVCTIESQPQSILYPKKIALQDLIILELLLEIDALDNYLGENWQPLSQNVSAPPLDLFAPAPLSELDEVLSMWQDAFEWQYYNEVLWGLKTLQSDKNRNALAQKTANLPKSFQAIFCIDERECSLRRHIEQVAPDCETLGCPGFFGVEFYFQPENGKFYEKLCPAPVTPKYLIKEYDVNEKRKHVLLYTKKTHTFLRGFLMSISLGFWASFKLVQHIFNPKRSAAISSSFSHMHIDGQLHIENKSLDDRENGLQVGFTVAEMATRVEGLLRGMGLVSNFAPIVYVVAHGSSSANNPHHGAYDCGACSGRPGSVNARVLAFMANHQGVRQILAGKGLLIPDTTQFLGALHDTAADEMAYYDEKTLSPQNAKAHSHNKNLFEAALDLNAKERSRRFSSINTQKDIKHVRNEVRKRAASLFEPRPELGHGTNALCFVGKRQLTKGLFLDRRAFMNSYDYRTDPNGDLLLGVMTPLPPVCGGINLEYYFSRIDNQKLGAGSKLPHNVMGLIGVANSSDGDLRPGLPLQMVEVHDPVRLLVLVEHYPEVILNTVQKSPALYEWFANEWVHLLAIHPDTNEFYFFRKGKFVPYQPLSTPIEHINNMQQHVEKAAKERAMPTNYIVDATKENLPVSIID